MADVIDARVRQKADTIAGWLSNDITSLDGEQLFIRSDVDGNVVGFKFGSEGKRFSELPYIDLSVRDKCSTSTVWTGKPSGVYVPTEDGDYGGVTVDLSDGYQIIFWDGSTRVKVVFPTDLSAYATKSEVDPLISTTDALNSQINGSPTGSGGATDPLDTYTSQSITGANTVLNRTATTIGGPISQISVNLGLQVASIRIKFFELVSGNTFRQIHEITVAGSAGINTYYAGNHYDVFTVPANTYIGAYYSQTAGNVLGKTKSLGSSFTSGNTVDGQSYSFTDQDVDIALSFKVGDSTGIASKVDDIESLSGQESVIYLPTELNSFTSTTYANISSWWTESTNYFGLNGVFQELTVISDKAYGQMGVAFVVIENNKASLLYSKTVDITTTGKNTFTRESLAVPSFVYAYDKVYVFVTNIVAGTIVRYTSGEPIGTSLFFSKTGVDISQGGNKFNFYIKIDNKGSNFLNKNESLSLSAKASVISSGKVTSYAGLLLAMAFSDIIEIGPVDIVIPSNLVVPSGKKLIGSGSKTRLMAADSSVTRLIDVSNSVDVSISSMTLKGVGADVVSTSTALINSTQNILDNANKGTGIGVYASNSNGLSLTNLYIQNFNNAGVYGTQFGANGTSPSQFTKGIKLKGLSIDNCYLGIDMFTRAEYSTLSDLTVRQCAIGIGVRSGNVAVSNSQFTNNRVGVYVGAGDNNSHGTFTGCFFNHNKFRGIYINGIVNGHAFGNCHMFDGIMEIVDSKGFNWNGGEIAGEIRHQSITATLNRVSNAMFTKTYNAGTIVETGTGSPLSLKNNFFFDGSDSSTINN